MDKQGKLGVFLSKAKKVHGEQYDYSKVDYINSTTKVCITCPEHGDFWQTPQSHIRGNKCPKCANKSRGSKKRWTTDEFVDKCIEVHGNEYDYSKVSYANSDTKVCIKCKKHGDFWQTPVNHLAGQGCPKCAGRTLSKEEVIEAFIKKHGDRYNYSKVNFKKMHNKVVIICPEHGEFLQTPSKHLSGQGCPVCAKLKNGENKRLSREEFLNRAIKIHGGAYNYDHVSFSNLNEDVEIQCNKHGYFKQRAADHLSGHGCPKCSNIISHNEIEIYEYLCEMLGRDKVVLRDRKVLNGAEIDIYIPHLHFGIEYHGLYWHSECGGKDRWYHYNKMKQCEEKGIRLIQIFEDEYIYHKQLVLSKISHILNITHICPKIAGRKCQIKEIGRDEAKEFLDNNHVQGYTNSSVRIGVYYQSVLIGVMTFSRKENENEWILNRFASDSKYICQGVGGKIFSYFVKKYNPETIVSFSDLRWGVDKENNLYTKLGFTLNSITKPDYYYINIKNPKERIHKFNFRKGLLSKRHGLPTTMTEKEMCEMIGYAKIWNCGLLRYVWTERKKER